MMFNATYNNISVVLVLSVVSWRSVLLVEETRGAGENHRHAASNWQTLSHNLVSSTPRHERAGLELTTLVVIDTDCTGSWIYIHTITTTTAQNMLIKYLPFLSDIQVCTLSLVKYQV